LVANGQPAFEGIGTAYINRENVAAPALTEDYLVTPLFNVPTNPQLKFMSRLTIPGNSAVPTIYRVMMLPPGLDASIPANYVQLEQWGELEINPSQEAWIEVNVTDPAFTALVGQQVRLAFVMLGDNGDRWLIDNVQVVSECVAPTTLTANNISLTGASLSWANPSGATAWDIEIVPQADAPTGVPTNTYNGTLPYVVTGLSQSTCYKYYVRARCTTTNLSTWAGPFSFCTVAPGATCSAPWIVTTLPFSTSNNTGNFGDDYNGSPGNTGCGTTGGYLNGDDVVYAYTATANGVISVNATGLGDWAGMFVYDDCADIGVSCIAGGTGNTTTPIAIPSLSVVAGTTYYIVISTWAAPQSTPYNLVIQAVNCAPPVGLPTTGIGQTSANLSWTNPSSATAWELVVQAPGSGIPAGSGVAVATNTNYLASGLTPATPYEYWVRAACGNGTFSAWAGPYLFNTTICEAVDQCNFSFVMTDSFGDGWNGNTMTVSQNGITIATIGSTFTTGLGPVTVTVPVCDDLPIQLYWNSGGAWAAEVGVTIQNNYGQPIYTKAPGVGTQNSLLYTGTVDCDNPACLPPNGLTATNIGTTTANIGWTGPATGTWEYYVVPQGDPAPTAATPGIATSSNPTTLTGLTISTCYQYYVRMVCTGANPTSDWAGPFSFCTDVCEAADQCNYTFNMTSNWWVGYSGATMTVSQNGTTVAVIGPSFTTGQSQSVTVPMCSNEPFEVFWTTGGTLSFQVGLNIVNNFGQTLYNMPFGTGTPGTLLYSADMDCLVPACLAPENLTVLGTTDTTADLGWAGPATGNWQYYVVPAGDPAPGATTTPTGTTTTNPVTATGLLPATNYQYYVRVVCSGTQNSPWAGPFAFNTDACAPTAQCMYTVEMIDSWGDGWNGNTMSIIQGGVTVATFGSTFTTGVGPITVQVPLCDGLPFQVFWNTGGAFANEVGVTMYSPFAEEVFTKAPGTGSQGTTIFSSLDGASCTPPLCPKPQNLTVTDILEESVELNWSEMGTATSWEIEIAELGTAPTGVGTVVTTNPFVWEDLESGTTYQFYIRAICGGDNGNSNWSGPVTFTTAIENDDCAGALPAPVNPGGECIEFSTGTLTGSTGSAQAQSCVTWMTLEHDVWYSFVAEATTHAVAITDAVGAFYQTVIYSGDNCGALTQLACGDDNQAVSGLTVGDTYYVRVFTTWLPDPTAVTSFHICIQTPEPPIAVSATQYTIPELVTEVLIDADCALVSNITSSSAANFGGGASIGYFTQNGSSFPFEDGVVLTTGMLTEAPGPWPGTVGTDPFPWPGDAQLQAFNTAAGWPAQTNNATILEFDFVPTINQLTFDFLYASAEYGTFQCSFSDMFAFILTDVTAAGTPVNLAVVPGTSIPVSATYINDSQWNAGCASQNPEYFGQYNAANPNASSIGYIGQTVPMTASSPVIPGNTYHIKLVIADYADTILNSAVFISGGSFNIGNIDLGSPMLEFTGTAACDGEVIVLDTEMDPDLYDFVWTLDGLVMFGETGPSITVTEQGLYGVTATFEGTDCDASGTVLIEYFEPIETITNDPNDLTFCDPDGFAEFNLEDNTSVIMDGIPGATGFTVTYHLSQADAENEVGALTSPYTNTTQYQQTIYVRIESASGCVGYKSFDLIIEDLTPTFTMPASLTLCGDSTGTITVVPGNFVVTDPNVSFAWTKDGVALADTGATITVSGPGVYDVVVNNSGCTATGSTTVTVSTNPTATIAYAGSPYCSNLATATVTHTGNTGGTYSATGTGAIVINPSTGAINIAQSEAGTYEVTYALAATPSCDPFSVTTTVVITEQPQTEFTYDSATFCMNVTSDAIPTFDEDAAAGTFTATPAGLTINPATGAITPSTSTAGVYMVTNTIAAANGCAEVSSQFEVTIIEAPVGTFSYDAAAYCKEGSSPVITITGTAGTFSANSDDLVIDSATGVIDLGASQAGNYTVYNTIAATADCDEVAFPVNVTIYATPSFDLGGPYVLCDATFATVTVNANNFTTGTATYAWTLDGVDTGDTGSSIQATAFGTYAVTVTTEDGCTSSLSVPVSEQTVGVDFEFMDECIDNVYSLMVMPVNGSFDPDTATYTWTVPAEFTGAVSTTSMIEPNVPGIYSVVFVTPEGCVGSNEFAVENTSCNIQKGISPGDAGDNNFFDLSTLDVTSLSIFNRYGQEVYSRSMYTNEWEGQDKKGNELPTGTYFYSFERANGETQTGWIYINRQN
jgi:gliding motility-associated-like protein